MPDSAVSIFESGGTASNIDTRTEDTNNQHRQVIVIGGPSVNAAVTEVASVDPGPTSTSYGTVVRLAGSASVQIVGSTGSAAVVLQTPAGSNMSDEGLDAVRVLIAGSQSNSSLVISGQQAAGTNRPLIVNTDGAIKIYDIVQGTVTANAGTGTLSVAFSPSGPLVLANTSATAVLPATASGSTSAVSTSGATIVSPEVGRVIKVYAFSLTSTGVVSLTARFTNGAGVSPTEFWRVAMQSPSGVASGANLAVTPPGYLFATASGSTLSLLLDSATLVHYSCSYFKESA